MGYREDKELSAYRNLIEPPEKFEDGFGVKTIVGAIFLGLLITPGSIYVMLVAGENVGPAARWVTVFLFSEVARRSLKELKQQEVFILYYMSAHVLLTNSGILWNIFMVQSDAFQAMGISAEVPNWVVPNQEILTETGRTLFSSHWLPAIGIIGLTMLISRIDHFGLGYFLYRITSDVERLPFPMAPIGASGIIAMAETKDKSQQWRPATFAVGGVIGLIFGMVYLGFPAITGILLREPLYILPIPWIEMTPTFKNIIPATAINIVPHLGMFVLGMVLPFWAVVGGFLGLVITFVLNPILYNGGLLREWFGVNYRGGILHTWKPGMETVDTLFSNQIDFYLSFGLGITFFIAFLGIGQAFWPFLKKWFHGKKTMEKMAAVSATESGWHRLLKGKPGRGDISIWLSLGIYVFSTASYITLSTYLVKGFPWPFFLIYGFVYTPLTGYAAAKIEGMAGQTVVIPMVKEATYILSGYKGVAIWYAPIPMQNYSFITKDFRIIELTGTRLRSIIKTDFVALPILFASLILFSSYIWSQGPLDSNQYPYVQKVWDLMSKNQALMISSTIEGQRSLFFEALRAKYLACGVVAAGGLYAVLSMFGLPIMLVFGVVRGLGQTNPAGLLPEFLGALVGRYYFKRKFGDNWTKYAPGVYAGFTCGIGLVGMMSVALRLIALSISPLQY